MLGILKYYTAEVHFIDSTEANLDFSICILPSIKELQPAMTSGEVYLYNIDVCKHLVLRWCPFLKMVTNKVMVTAKEQWTVFSSLVFMSKMGGGGGFFSLK